MLRHARSVGILLYFLVVVVVKFVYELLYAKFKNCVLTPEEYLSGALVAHT